MKQLTLYFVILLFSLSYAVSAQTPAPTSDSQPPWYAEALKLHNEKQYDASLEKIRAVFENYSDNYYLRMLAAANHYRLNNTDSSFAHIRAAEKIAPERYETFMLSAAVYRQVGNSTQALNALKKAASLNAPAASVKLEMSRLYYETAQYAKARGETDQILAADAKNAEAMYIDGLIFLKQSKWESAEFRFRQILLMGGLPAVYTADIYNNMGFALENISIQASKPGNAQESARYKKEAESFYKKSLQSDSKHAAAQANLNHLNAPAN
jgi:Tfp pilus assembly protein PilF